MAPTAQTFAEGSPMNPVREPDPERKDLEQALGAAAEAGREEYDEDEVNPEYQGEISADDAGATRMSQEMNKDALHRQRERELPKPPPDEASG